MTVKVERDFEAAARVGNEPTGDYATAREVLDDLPAIVMKRFGAGGVRIASYMVKRYGNEWRRTDRQGFKRKLAFAATALCNPDLSPDQRAHFEVMVLIGGVFNAAEKQKTRHHPATLKTTASLPSPKERQARREAKDRKLARLRGELNLRGYKAA